MSATTHSPLPWELLKKHIDNRIAQFWIKSHGADKDQHGSRFILPLSAEGLHHIDWCEKNLNHIIKCVNAYDDLIKESSRLQDIVERHREVLECIRNDYNAAKAGAEDECTIAIGSGVKTAAAFAYRDMKIGMIRAKLFRIEKALSLTATEKDVE